MIVDDIICKHITDEFSLIFYNSLVGWFCFKAYQPHLFNFYLRGKHLELETFYRESIKPMVISVEKEIYARLATKMVDSFEQIVSNHP